MPQWPSLWPSCYSLCLRRSPSSTSAARLRKVRLLSWPRIHQGWGPLARDLHGVPWAREGEHLTLLKRTVARLQTLGTAYFPRLLCILFSAKSPLLLFKHLKSYLFYNRNRKRFHISHKAISILGVSLSLPVFVNMHIYYMAIIKTHIISILFLYWFLFSCFCSWLC